MSALVAANALAVNTPVKIAIIVALTVERSCVPPQPSDTVKVMQCGQGRERAVRAAQSAIAGGANALLSLGIAGGLSPALQSGDVVVPEQILVPEDDTSFATSEGWSDNLCAALRNRFAVDRGAVLDVVNVVANPGQRRSAHAAFGASACDMESAGVASVASESGAAFAAIKVISDMANDTLPAGIQHWVDDDGNSRIAPFLMASLKPNLWGQLFRVVAGFSSARNSLTAACRTLSAGEFIGVARDSI